MLDPFIGSGTTAEEAIRNSRKYLGCELNPDYEKMQQDRILNANAVKCSKPRCKPQNLKSHPDLFELA